MEAFSSSGASKKEDTLAQTVPECMTCRLVGGAVLTGTGAYSIYSARPGAPNPATRYGRRVMTGLGVLFIVAGMARGLGVQHTHVLRAKERIETKLGWPRGDEKTDA